MSASITPPDSDRSAASELYASISCAGMRVAIPLASVERLVLADDVRVLGRERAPNAEVQQPLVVCWGDRRYAGWDLAELLGAPSERRAWALLRVTHRGAELGLALGVDRCLSVEAVRDAKRLPAALFQQRASAFFAVGYSRGRAETSALAVCLDPNRLWTETELELSKSALAAAALRLASTHGPT